MFYFYFSGRVRHEYIKHGILKHPNVCEVCRTPYKNRHVCPNRKRRDLLVREDCICKICGKQNQSKMKLRLHMINLHGVGKDNEPHICKFCGKSFGAEQILRAHVQQSHSRVNCPHCQKSLMNSFYLKKHLIMDHGINKESALFCDFCPKKLFFSEGFLKKHMQEKHGSTE